MKIGILGTAHTFHQAPFDDLSWELWGCNIGPVPRWDCWFEFHDDASIDTYPGHRAWLEAQTKPIYLRDTTASIPAGIPYPIDHMRAKYGDWFFTSTIAYMLAEAIERKPDEIGLWGVDMAADSEYVHQKPGCRFFIQVARMAGIKVTLPAECEVAAPGRLYAYEGQPLLKTKAVARKSELQSRAAAIDAQRQSLVLERAALQGARDIKLTPEDIQKRLDAIPAQEQELERASLVMEGGILDMDHVLQNWCGD